MIRTMFAVVALALVVGPVAADEVPVTVGQNAPDFTLPDLDGNEHTLSKMTAEKPTVIMFYCPTCPTVRRQAAAINAFATANADKVHFVAISSNRGETVAHLRDEAKKNGVTFTILRDEGNVVADLYDAQTTPHVYLVDTEGKLAYIGNLVTKRGATPTAQRWVDALVAGEELPEMDRSTQPYG